MVVGFILIVVGTIFFFIGRSIISRFSSSDAPVWFMFFGISSILAGLILSVMGAGISKIPAVIQSQPVVTTQLLSPQSIVTEQLKNDAIQIKETI